MQSPLLAFVDITILLVLIVATIILFARHSKIAADMLMPYLMWAVFAAYLNWTIWRMN